MNGFYSRELYTGSKKKIVTWYCDVASIDVNKSVYET